MSDFSPWAPFASDVKAWWQRNHAQPWSTSMPAWAPYAQPPAPSYAGPGAPLPSAPAPATPAWLAGAKMPAPPPMQPYDPTGGIAGPLARPPGPPTVAMSQAPAAAAQPAPPQPPWWQAQPGLFQGIGSALGRVPDSLLGQRTGGPFSQLGGTLGGIPDFLLGTTTGPSLINKMMGYINPNAGSGS